MKQISGNLILDEDGGRIFLRVTSRAYAEKLDGLGIQSSPLSHGRMYVLPRTEEGCRLCRNFGEDATECAPFMDAEHPLVEGKYRPMNMPSLRCTRLAHTRQDLRLCRSLPRLRCCRIRIRS